MIVAKTVKEKKIWQKTLISAAVNNEGKRSNEKLEQKRNEKKLYPVKKEETESIYWEFCPYVWQQKSKGLGAYTVGHTYINNIKLFSQMAQ